MYAYDEYMKSDIWRAVRSKRLILDGFRCQLCGSVQHLEVHHMKYPEQWGGEDIDHDLITLCADCHHRLHVAIKEREAAFDRAKDTLMENARAACKGELDKWADEVIPLFAGIIRDVNPIPKNKTTAMRIVNQTLINVEKYKPDCIWLYGGKIVPSAALHMATEMEKHTRTMEELMGC